MLASQVEDTPDDIGPYYPCQIDDVVLVSQTLLRCFRGQSVPHVVNSIIDHAEYWLRLSASKREAREVTGYRRAWPFTATEQNPCRTAYLQTPPIHKHGQHLPLAIKRVKIWITGKDQGWCTVNDDGSWTWWVVVRQSLEGRMGSASLHESAPELPDSWAEGPELVRNEQAGNDYKVRGWSVWSCINN